jgi:hypothetical protein
LIVIDIINTAKKMREWGVEGNLIVMKGKKYGLITDDLSVDSDIIFLKRGPNEI